MLVLLVGGAALPPPLPPLARPVEGPVTRGFSSDGAYGPGHRGLDLRAAPGTPVAAPAGGRVTFAGSVAGLRWVTLAPDPRVLVTVGPLSAVRVSAGDVVAAGSLVGAVAAGHAGALHLSVRVDGRHVDPAPLLVAGVQARLTLLPLEGRTGHRSAVRVPDGVPHGRVR